MGEIERFQINWTRQILIAYFKKHLCVVLLRIELKPWLARPSTLLLGFGAKVLPISLADIVPVDCLPVDRI